MNAYVVINLLIGTDVSAMYFCMYLVRYFIQVRQLDTLARAIATDLEPSVYDCACNSFSC